MLSHRTNDKIRWELCLVKDYQADILSEINGKYCASLQLFDPRKPCGIEIGTARALEAI